MGNLLTLGYKTTLLSSLIPINYEDSFDNFFDIDKSGLPLLMPKGTNVVEYIRGAPGEMMARIFNRKILHSINTPKWADEMYA